MVVQVIGIQLLNFTTKEGNVIKGTNLFVAYPRENVVGLVSDKIFVPHTVSLPKEMRENAKVDISFDNRKHIEKISLC
jgi:hypothetical protein